MTSWQLTPILNGFLVFNSTFFHWTVPGLILSIILSNKIALLHSSYKLLTFLTPSNLRELIQVLKDLSSRPPSSSSSNNLLAFIFSSAVASPIPFLAMNNSAVNKVFNLSLALGISSATMYTSAPTFGAFPKTIPALLTRSPSPRAEVSHEGSN